VLEQVSKLFSRGIFIQCPAGFIRKDNTGRGNDAF